MQWGGNPCPAIAAAPAFVRLQSAAFLGFAPGTLDACIRSQHFRERIMDVSPATPVTALPATKPPPAPRPINDDGFCSAVIELGPGAALLVPLPRKPTR
jgi:hypothetical protein